MKKRVVIFEKNPFPIHYGEYVCCEIFPSLHRWQRQILVREKVINGLQDRLRKKIIFPDCHLLENGPLPGSRNQQVVFDVLTPPLYQRRVPPLWVECTTAAVVIKKHQPRYLRDYLLQCGEMLIRLGLHALLAAAAH